MVVQSDESGIRTTAVVFDIVESIMRREGATLLEIAEDVDRSKSTLYAHLVTLVDLGYVRKDEAGYRLGIKFLDLGTHARETYEFYGPAKRKLRRLADETGERAQLMVEADGRGVYILREEGAQAIPAAVRLGRPRHLHLSSAGKAILAHLEEERVDEIVETWGLPTQTAHSVTDRDRLDEELGTIRERGYATNRQESIQGAWSIGVPVRRGESVVAAISLSGPAHRLGDGGELRDDVTNLVMAYAEEIGIESTIAD